MTLQSSRDCGNSDCSDFSSDKEPLPEVYDAILCIAYGKYVNNK